MCCAGQAPCRRLRVTSNVRHQVERPCYFNASSAALSRRAREQPRVVRARFHLHRLNLQFLAGGVGSMSSRPHPSARLQRSSPCFPVSSSGAAHRTALPAATTPRRSAEGKAQSEPRLQRLPPSVSVSSSGAARRKSLPVATTPWRSAQREAEATCRIEHLPLPSTRLLPNPSVNATRTSRRLGARGRPALSSARAPSPLPARARYLKR